jgi:hypothetical protein
MRVLGLQPEEIRAWGITSADSDARRQFEMLREQGRIFEDEAQAVAEARLRVLNEQIAAEEKLVRQGNQQALNRQRAAREEKEQLEAAIRRNEAAMALYDLYQDQWDALQKQFDAAVDLDKAIESIGKESDVTFATQEGMLGSYMAARSALSEMVELQAKINDISDSNTAELNEQIAALRSQLQILGALYGIRQQMLYLREQGRMGGMYEAAGGEGYVPAGGLVSSYRALSESLRDRASKTTETKQKEQLLETAYENEKNALKSQLEYSSGFADTRERIADLYGDEVDQQRALSSEYARQANVLETYWPAQLAYIRQMGISEDQVAEARISHESQVAELRKKSYDESRNALRTVYDREVRLLESARDLAGKLRDNKAEQARYELRIALIKEVQARLDYDDSNDQIATNNVIQKRLALLREEHEQTIRELEASRDLLAVRGLTVLQGRLYGQALQGENAALAEQADINGNIVEAANRRLSVEENILSTQERELSTAEAHLSLVESMAEQGMATEDQVTMARRAAAAEALESLRQYRYGTLENIQATQKWFDIMYGDADRTRDKFKGIIDSIVGVPQELVNRFMSPASMMRVFGGETLGSVIGGLRGVGPRRGADIQGNFTIQILGLPENLVKIVDQKIQIGNQQFAMQLIPLMRGA